MRVWVWGRGRVRGRMLGSPPNRLGAWTARSRAAAPPWGRVRGRGRGGGRGRGRARVRGRDRE